MGITYRRGVGSITIWITWRNSEIIRARCEGSDQVDLLTVICASRKLSGAAKQSIARPNLK